MKNTTVYKEHMNDIKRRENLQNRLNNKKKYQDENYDIKLKLMNVFKNDFSVYEVSNIRKDVMSEIRKVTDKISDDYLNDRYFSRMLTFDDSECFDENNDYDEDLEEKLYEEFEEDVKEEFNCRIHNYLENKIYEVFQNVLVDTKKMSLEEYYKLRDRERELELKIITENYWIDDLKKSEVN
tara:strand:- start:207 stop:752 length:546 start_codon:yes stop_codon:yes gene_type:complete